jgi:transposase-like protein
MKPCTILNSSFAPGRKWVELYAATRNAALVCRRCGICAPTLRNWWRRFQAEGEAGLPQKVHESGRDGGRVHALVRFRGFIN